MAEVDIDAGYPGGNVVLERIDGNVVYLHQDIRDTEGWWFYWNFRVRGAARRMLTFRFTNKNVIGIRGPAVSLDAGVTWFWLGTETVKSDDKGASFSYTFAPDVESVRFAFVIPYQEAEQRRFLAQHEGNKHLAICELCKTRKGRSIERMHIGKLDGEPAQRILLTCRHHCCESIASYVLEGILTALLADTENGEWFRQNIEVLAVPFMDKDGVDDGDQGKNRRPHDHWLDYEGKSLYPSVRALREFVPRWSAGRLSVAFDLHCPYIGRQTNENLFQVGSQNKAIWDEQCNFGRILESIPDKCLPYNASDALPFGRGWNTAKHYGVCKSFLQWAEELKGIRLCSVFETPYASAGNVTVTPRTARALGTYLIQALCQYLQQ